MAKIELNDRIELSDIFADCTHAGSSQFFTDNESLSFTIDPNDILPPRFTNLTNYPLYVVGKNQQTNREYTIKYEENSIYGSDWDLGYYKIYISQINQGLTNGRNLWPYTSSIQQFNLNKKPIYWNKSPLQFMTYIDSGSFELGRDRYEIEYETADNNRSKKYLINILKPFFIGRTMISKEFYSKFDTRYISTSQYDYGRVRLLRNISSSSQDGYKSIARIYYTDGTVKLNSNFYNTDTLPSGYTTSSLNNDIFYIVNSSGKDSNGNITTTTNNSFVENLLQSSASLDDNNCSLKNQGWIWNIPTECQWEYACRADTSTQISNGTNINIKSLTGQDSDFNDIQWSQNSISNNAQYLALLKPNKWGLFDMNGIYYEITKDSGPQNADDYNTTFAGSPFYDEENQRFVARGGQYNDFNSFGIWQNTSGFRYLTQHIGDGSLTYGFRLTIVQP